MNKKRLFILIITIFIIILIFIIFFAIKRNNSDKEEISFYDEDIDEVVEYKNKWSGKIATINDRMIIYDIKNILNKFYLYSYYLNSSSEYLTVDDIDYYKNSMLNVLDNKYLIENEIEKDNISQKFKVEEEMIVQILKVYMYTDFNNVRIYFVNGCLNGFRTGKYTDFNATILLDFNNMTYSIYFGNIYSGIDLSTLKVGDEYSIEIPKEILKNEYNVFSRASLKLDEFCEDYLIMIRDYLLYDIERAYALIDEGSLNNYKTIDDFKNFINENRKEILKMSYGTYEIYTKDNSEVIRIFDNSNIFYIDLIFDGYSTFTFSINLI